MLTNDHLNEMFVYLDQQNRWTRNKLIGIGIVCGFNIVHHTGVIEITKGCGVTSQGYLILKGAGNYAYIMPYVPADQPADLPFAYTGNLPFYKPFCQGKTIYLLLTDDEYNNLEDNKKPQAQTLSSQKSGFLNDYVVVLFLEATETDLKNCSAFDCTNKGEKMQFNVRPLLVAKKDMPGTAATIVTGAEKDKLRFTELEIEKERARLHHEITFKRYNVPYTAIRSSTDVIKAFVKIVDDNTLQEVANAYMFCYEKYASLLNEASNPFAGLFKALQTYRDTILKDDPIFIQYFYDFVDDLILAYYEFCVKITGIVSKCCPDENLFPLHLVLGDASKDTAAFTHDAWRTYFIYSPLFTKSSGEANEAQFFFRRMLIMVKTFTILSGAASRKTSTIKITPSQYGYAWLSQRAIPYYYHIGTGANAIYNYWNYYKSSHGNAIFNLSYNASLYNNAKAAVQPLLYDIEHYNFFRIEGHIGENYGTVLNNILRQRLEYNLPFDVVAISADMLRSNAKLPVCNMQDLETDYKLIISEFACKVHTPFCFLTKFPYPPNTDSFKAGAAGGIDLEKFSVYRTAAIGHFSILTGNITSSNSYKLGDFMRKYCLPDDNNTVGGYYLQSLDSVNRIYTNEVDSLHRNAEQNALFLVYDYIFAFIDAVEQLMLVLMTSTVSNLDITLLQRRYEVYTKSVSRLALILAELLTSESLKLSAFMKQLELDMLIDEFFILSTVCIDERLQTLIDEYNRRLHVFQLQNTFLNYYKKHPGLEHKAGVPKGGTFVLVYYSATEIISTQRGEVAIGNITAERTLETQQQGILYRSLSSSDERMIKTFVENCKDASPGDKTKIIDIFNPKPINQRFSFKEGEVIADFYVPYLCCSDCPPIAYILPEKPPAPPVDTPTIKMGTTFCDNDDKPEKITVSPAGGKVTDEQGNEVKGVDNTAFTFTPQLAGAGIYNLVYTQNNVASDPAKVTVLATPKDSSFTFKSVFADQGVFTVTFTPNIPDDNFTYAWTFGAGFSPATSSDREPVITATVNATGGETFTSASLQVSNGTCPGPLSNEDLTITGNGVFETTSLKVEIDKMKGLGNIDKTVATPTGDTTKKITKKTGGTKDEIQ